MGACASCLESLGFGGKDDSERQRLLSHQHDTYNTGYAGYPPSPSGHHHHNGVPDAQQLLQTREFLDRIVTETSENLIDIYAPPMITTAPSSMTPNTRGDWYRTLLERTSPPKDVVEMPIVLDPKTVGIQEREWLDLIVKKGEEAVRDVARVKEVGRLVVALDSL